VLRCPDGYRGGFDPNEKGEVNASALDALREAEKDYELNSPEDYGYDDFQSKFDGNPFSNKIIIMDEVHDQHYS
jgi:hypothetical protein